MFHTPPPPHHPHHPHHPPQDHSVLERHHINSAKAVIRESQLLDHFLPDDRQAVLTLMEDMILATDVSRHKDFMVQFEVGRGGERGGGRGEGGGEGGGERGEGRGGTWGRVGMDGGYELT